MTFEVICRWCGHRMQVLNVPSAGCWLPNDCARCESDDLVALRELNQAELEDVEQAIEDRRR